LVAIGVTAPEQGSQGWIALRIQGRGGLNKSGVAAALRLRQICQVVMRTAT
jgi:hypothetical protein